MSDGTITQKIGATVIAMILVLATLFIGSWFYKNFVANDPTVSPELKQAVNDGKTIVNGLNTAHVFVPQQEVTQDNIVGCWFRESKYGFDPTDYIKFDNGGIGVNHATPMTWERKSAEFVNINVEGYPIIVYQIAAQPDLFKYGGIDTYKRGNCSQIRIQ